MTWCLNFLKREGRTLELHHERFKAACKLDGGSWGVQEHLSLTGAIKAAVMVDQLDPANSVALEMLFRRLQTIEFSHSERAKEAESKGVSGRLTAEEQMAFAGSAKQVAGLMVCPRLLEHVRIEVERDASLAKNLRKAREERDALRQKK